MLVESYHGARLPQPESLVLLKIHWAGLNSLKRGTELSGGVSGGVSVGGISPNEGRKLGSLVSFAMTKDTDEVGIRDVKSERMRRLKSGARARG